MQVHVTRSELLQAAAMLEELKRWEPLCKIAGEYNRGEILLKMDGNVGKEAVGLSVDRYGIRNHKDKTELDKMHREIACLAAEAAEELAVAVCNLIKKSMPFVLSEEGAQG